MKGYKVFNKDWKCLDFQYEVGKEYHHDDIKICEKGFHFCEKLTDCFSYYDFDPKNKVAEIEAAGDVIKEGEKSVTDNIKIIKEITWADVLNMVNAGISNTGLGNSGNRNSGYKNPGDRNSGDRNSGDWNSGNWNSGNWNKTGYSTGFFNTENKNIFIFNKDSGLTRDRFINSIDIPSCLYFDLTEWINSDNMSEQEKIDNPNYKTTDGYLKTYSYQEAAIKSISQASEKDKQLIRALPNFDPGIFEEIFGIRI